MRLNNVFSGRPSPWDRNPVGIALNFTQVQAPVGNTIEWTYTVPTGRKAFLDSANMSSTRATAAAPAADVFQTIGLTVFVSSGLVALSWLHWLDNTIAVLRQGAAVGGPTLLAGDILNSRYSDASTGGTVNTSITAHLTEFDA